MPLLSGILFFIPLLFEHYGTYYPLLGTLNALFYFLILFRLDSKQLFFSGFFTSVFLFYWIGLSFRYYDLAYAIPFVILFVGIVYGFLFWFLLGYLSERAFGYGRCFKAFVILVFSYIHPFGFDWFKFELIATESYFGVDKVSFLLLVLSVVAHFKNIKLFPLFLALALYFGYVNTKESMPSTQKITLHESRIPQDKKWDREYFAQYVDENIRVIKNAIGKSDVIVLPESAFPMLLNMDEDLTAVLKELSREITIIAGSLRYDEKGSFNSAYIFQNGEMRIADKVVLVPFGERNPLPEFLSDIVNDIFFNGAEDYKGAERPTDITIGGEAFRIAICYEATSEEFLRAAPKNVIAISNNGWFHPSAEPALQKLLMRYYAKREGITFYHAVNMSQSGVVGYRR